ncbi:MAG: TIGR02391 family protein [Euryarchaeota archaeon]|jgi:uncharacterized protein (TIGR02391 family)|nr:TIGR02391 family protein [Euryarchaeota archaeon]
MAAKYRLIAVQVGDALKYETSINEINRIAGAIFSFRCESFPNNSITSSRAQLVHDWILSLARQRMGEDERNKLLKLFCDQLSGEGDLRTTVHSILQASEISLEDGNKDRDEFLNRGFHNEVIKHCRELFLQGNYFHAVFEACKVYNKLVGEKALSSKDGEPLMMDVWGWQNGVLKVTACQTETDKNVQDGIKFLSAGLMKAMRNPTAHEPALHWPITREDCLDMLNFVSFLLRQLDKAVYYKATT